jgi:hypothetical protein
LADREPLRPYGTRTAVRAAAVLGGALLGLTVALPATTAFAASRPGTAATPAPDLPHHPPVEAADPPSTSTTTTT